MCANFYTSLKIIICSLIPENAVTHHPSVLEKYRKDLIGKSEVNQKMIIFSW